QEIMQGALEQANRARNAILDVMLEVIPESRAELSQNAPRITSVKIDPEKIGMVIGKGGETIRGLEADYEVQIDIEEDGTILIYATDGEKAAAGIAAIQALTKEPEVGDTYTGKVVKTTQFGAFVELKKGTDGLLHVSNVGPGRVGHIEDVIHRGDILDVLVQEVDKARGRIGLKLIQKHENGNTVSPEELIERAKDAPPRDREAELARVLELGGRLVETKSHSVGDLEETWTVMRDPEGNGFCVQSPPNPLPGRYIGNVTFSCAEPQDLGRFWANALGWPDEEI